MASEKRTGTSIPSGILQPTMPPEPAIVEPTEEQGGATENNAEDISGSKTRTPRRRAKQSATPASKKLEGRRLYLSEDPPFRLRMLAYQKNQTISEAAEEVLRKNLPQYEVSRTG